MHRRCACDKMRIESCDECSEMKIESCDESAEPKISHWIDFWSELCIDVVRATVAVNALIALDLIGVSCATLIEMQRMLLR